MAGPITWQNVAAPNFSDAFRGMATAQQGFDTAFTGLGDLIKKREATEAANYEQGKVNNTNAFLASVQEAKTPEEFAAREAALRTQLAGYGSQVDAAAARSALDGRLGTLQQRSVANQQFTDQQVDVAGRPIAAGYNSALAQATKTDTVQGLMESIQIATGAGAVDPRLATMLTEKALARSAALTAEARAAEDQVWQGQNYQKTWEHQANQDSIARANLAIQRENVAEQRRAREAASADAGIRARTAHLIAAGDLVKNQTAASQEIKKNTPYAEMFGGTNMDLINKAASAANDGDPKYGNAVIDKITALRKTMPDIPVDVITAAISMAKNEFGASLWRSDGYSNSVVDHIKNQMRDPAVLDRIAIANEQIGKAQGKYESTSVEPAPQPKGNAAIGVAPSGVAAPSAPQTKFVPPKVSASGSLVYDKPGSLNISGNKGVMVPAAMPTGSLEATVKDGDTIGVKGANGVSMDFRFNGLDTQETGKTKNGKTIPGQKFGEAAKAFITDAFKQGRVDIKVSSNKPDAYGRLVADIYVDGKSLNEAMVRNGLATVLSVDGGMGPSQTAEFQRLQKLAMVQNLGIMGDMNSGRTPTGTAYRMFGDNLYN